LAANVRRVKQQNRPYTQNLHSGGFCVWNDTCNRVYLTALSMFSVIQTTFDSYSFLGNTVWDYILALGIFLAALSALKVFQVSVLKRLDALTKKSKTYVDDCIVEGITSIRKPLYVAASLLVSLELLAIPSALDSVVQVFLWLIIIWYAIQAFGFTVDAFIQQYMSRYEADDVDHAKAMLQIVRGFVIGILWIVSLLFIASNLGVDITSLIAGLGIGGIAIALALQKLLSDLFSSFSIFIDKPFRVGDYIAVGDDQGTVKYIGLKSTRIETLRGEELIIPNTQLTSARIQNFRSLDRRRDVIVFGVVCSTSKEHLASIPQLVQEIVNSTKQATFDRCHFKAISESALDFELVYYAESEQYTEFMAIRQVINAGILAVLHERNIALAYPTQTIHITQT
jgi:small-conductance mechanosensitive channel